MEHDEAKGISLLLYLQDVLCVRYHVKHTYFYRTVNLNRKSIQKLRRGIPRILSGFE